jgi:hypothetical protein
MTAVYSYGCGKCYSVFSLYALCSISLFCTYCRAVAPGGFVSFYAREPSFDQLPKQAQPGDILTGTITYIKKNTALLGSGTKPGGFAVKYVVADTKPPAAAATTAAPATATTATAATAAVATTPVVVTSNANAGDITSSDPTPAPDSSATPTTTSATTSEVEGGLEAAVREAKIKYLKAQSGNKATFESAYATISAEYPTSLPVRQTLLAHAVKVKATAMDGYKKSATAIATAAVDGADTTTAAALATALSNASSPASGASTDSVTATSAAIADDVKVDAARGELLFVFCLSAADIMASTVYLSTFTIF